MQIKESHIETVREAITDHLDKTLPQADQHPCDLHQAMRYSVLSPGKRIRGLMAFLCGSAFNAKEQALLSVAASLELIHAFSLIHDDLPALDNDDLRRGRPTCHKAFGEACAILAGDALHTLAFEILAGISEEALNASQKCQLILSLAQATGSKGMVGGEDLDIRALTKQQTKETLIEFYQMKTGALLGAALTMGAIAGGVQDNLVLSDLTALGQDLGLAFQIQDDILGLETQTDILGKQQGADLLLNKPTYPHLLGMEAAKKDCAHLFEKSKARIQDLGLTDLYALIEAVIARQY